jgi:hypothetical protein
MYNVTRGYRTNARLFWEIPRSVYNAIIGSLLTKNSVESRVGGVAIIAYSVGNNRVEALEKMWA